MAIAAGARLGPYEIVSAVGAGGMGEVYRANDTRLDRTVAIKILSSADPSLEARFEREAKAIAGLTHPHICTLYDVGQENGTKYLVMEYLDGQTLDCRLQRGPLALHEALRVAVQIADALDTAHRAGVVHHDLKPGNIMMTSSGAKLLDFGLAKLRPVRAGFSGDITAIATQSAPLTSVGSLVGTLQYMAPEQLDGHEADARSDLFAFGAVLYEMTTGRRAFAGSGAASVIAAIMSSEPPTPDLQKLAPRLEHLVKTCLIKDPERRWQSAHDVVLELEWIASAQREEEGPVARTRRHDWKWVSAAGAVGALALSFAQYLAFSEPQRPAIRLSVLPPQDAGFVGSPAISSDGARLAFTARAASGQTALWIRALDSSTSVAINGTAGATDPFWSPDNRSIGFFAQGKLKTVSAQLGSGPAPVQTLADAPQPRGGAWSADGTIVFARNIEDGLYRVAATGGEVTRVTTLDLTRLENAHRWPQFLPDGRHLLFFARSSSSAHQGIYVGI
ncbi:MAG TPA: protein kinase, partial [Vicinamibacterales bacterium]|nr:protein kinase [Vicinamibacterales bacterium]